MQSEYQAGTTQIFVRAPAKPRGGPLLALYVLPVEPHDEKRWGDARAEIAKLDIADRYGNGFGVVCVFPTLSHCRGSPTIRAIRRSGRKTYFLKVVVPFIERTYPVGTDRSRARCSASASPAGARGRCCCAIRRCSARPAAWDAPMTMDKPRYGMAPIVGTQENFERYRVTTLLRERGKLLGSEPRLMLTGWDFYRDQTHGARKLMQEPKIPHVYRDGPQRKHHWNSGWMADLARWVVR